MNHAFVCHIITVVRYLDLTNRLTFYLMIEQKGCILTQCLKSTFIKCSTPSNISENLIRGFIPFIYRIAMDTSTVDGGILCFLYWFWLREVLFYC
jgi:hypothetical protein